MPVSTANSLNSKGMNSFYKGKLSNILIKQSNKMKKLNAFLKCTSFKRSTHVSSRPSSYIANNNSIISWSCDCPTICHFFLSLSFFLFFFSFVLLRVLLLILVKNLNQNTTTKCLCNLCTNLTHNFSKSLWRIWDFC